MVKLRLSRAGAKKKPYYRIVAADERYPRDGRFLEQVGTYDPRTTPSKVTLETAALERWLKDGAVVTEKVEQLVRLHPEGASLWNATRIVKPEALKASAERARAARVARKERKAAARKTSEAPKAEKAPKAPAAPKAKAPAKASTKTTSKKK